MAVNNLTKKEFQALRKNLLKLEALTQKRIDFIDNYYLKPPKAAYRYRSLMKRINKSCKEILEFPHDRI